MLALDTIAKRYGLLPSMVLGNGAALDYGVAQLALAVENARAEQLAAEVRARG